MWCSLAFVRGFSASVSPNRTNFFSPAVFFNFITFFLSFRFCSYFLWRVNSSYIFIYFHGRGNFFCMYLHTAQVKDTKFCTGGIRIFRQRQMIFFIKKIDPWSFIAFRWKIMVPLRQNSSADNQPWNRPSSFRNFLVYNKTVNERKKLFNSNIYDMNEAQKSPKIYIWCWQHPDCSGNTRFTQCTSKLHNKHSISYERIHTHTHSLCEFVCIRVYIFVCFRCVYSRNSIKMK